MTLADQGDVGGEDIATGAYTFYPSIAVNENNDMAIGFALSSNTTYAGAYYTSRESGDPAGTVKTTSLLAAGQDYCVRTLGGAANRWGDYSGMSLDPGNGLSFWVFNEYAMTRGTFLNGEDGRWATRFGKFDATDTTGLACTSVTTAKWRPDQCLHDTFFRWLQ